VRLSRDHRPSLGSRIDAERQSELDAVARASAGPVAVVAAELVAIALVAYPRGGLANKRRKWLDEAFWIAVKTHFVSGETGFSRSLEHPIPLLVDLAIRLWQLVLLIAVVALAAGVLIGHSFTGKSSTRNSSGDATSATVFKQELERQQRRELRLQAEANVRAATPALEAYNADHSNGYAGVTIKKLQSYDAGVQNIAIVTANAASYCIQNTAPVDFTYHKTGSAGAITPGAC
jgi:hypothetical protein